MEETEIFAKEFAQKLKKGDIVLLCGDLGAGKTAFTRGLYEGLGGKEDLVTSPTFTILERHETPQGLLYHSDLYRLNAFQDLLNIDFNDWLEDADFIVIEWGDKFSELQKMANYIVEMESLEGDGRKISIVIPAKAGIQKK